MFATIPDSFFDVFCLLIYTKYIRHTVSITAHIVIKVNGWLRLWYSIKLKIIISEKIKVIRPVIPNEITEISQFLTEDILKEKITSDAIKAK